MKALSVILSIIILLLVLTPCVDRHAMDHAFQNEICKDTPGSHQDDADHCSPFCTCQCCQGSCYVSVFPVIVALQSATLVFQEIILNTYNTDREGLFIPPRA